MNNFFNTLVITFRQNRRLFILTILAFILSIFGTNDFMTATSTYRHLNFDNPFNFVIEKKYNKVERKMFPDLQFYGRLLKTNNRAEVAVSRGDFDEHSIGDTLTIFKHQLKAMYMTQYEFNNQKFIKIFGRPVSFVIIPTFLSFLTGLITLTILIRKFKTISNGG